MPPPRAITGRNPSRFGHVRSKAIASSRLDFPEPFGPIRTLRQFSSNGSLSGPNDRRLRGVIAFSSRGPFWSVASINLSARLSAQGQGLRILLEAIAGG